MLLEVVLKEDITVRVNVVCELVVPNSKNTFYLDLECDNINGNWKSNFPRASRKRSDSAPPPTPPHPPPHTHSQPNETHDSNFCMRVRERTTAPFCSKVPRTALKRLLKKHLPVHPGQRYNVPFVIVSCGTRTTES